MALLVTIVALIYEFLVDPFFDRLFLANEILCGGERDFIYAQNQATGLIHVTRTPDSGSSTSWTALESMVLQTAAINLQQVMPKTLMKVDLSQWAETVREKGRAWDPSLFLGSAGGSRSVAVIEPRNVDGTRALSLAEALSSPSSIDFLDRLRLMTTENAVNSLPCLDMQAGPSEKETLAELRALVGRSDAPPCYDAGFYRDFCWQHNMTRLRALCPVACECHFPLSVATGHFGTQAYGCPTGCAEMSRSQAEQMLQAGVTHPYYLRPCSDVQEDAFRDDYLTRDWLFRYMGGVAETVMNNPDKIQSAAFLMNRLGIGGMPVLEGLRDGTFFYHIAIGDWKLAEGIPHPRGLTGCDFLGSWEIAMILGAHLCGTGEYRSIRFFCPRTCGCNEFAEADGEECPITCYKGGVSQECSDLLRVRHSGSPEYDGIYHKTHVQSVYPNMGMEVYVNSNGKYVYPWKHNSEDYGHWMLGDTWSVPAYNIYASDGATCPDFADWNRIQVEKVTCPLMVQVESVGASLTLPLGVYTVIDVVPRRARPIYSRSNTSYLYYWQPTKQWLIGYSYSDASAVFASFDAQDAACPTHAPDWKVLVNNMSTLSITVSTYYVTDWRFSFDGSLGNTGSTSASPRLYGQIEFGDGPTENSKSLSLPGNFGTFVDLGQTAVGRGSFSICAFIKFRGGQVILDMAGTPPGVQGQMAHNLIVTGEDDYEDEVDDEGGDEEEGGTSGVNRPKLIVLFIRDEVPATLRTWEEQLMFAQERGRVLSYEARLFFDLNSWMHFCISVNEETGISVYKNGRLHHSSPHFSTPSAAIRWESYLGACHWWLSQGHLPLKGDIHQLTIRTKEVNEVEAAALYGNGRGNATFFN